MLEKEKLRLVAYPVNIHTLAGDANFVGVTMMCDKQKKG